MKMECINSTYDLLYLSTYITVTWIIQIKQFYVFLSLRVYLCNQINWSAFHWRHCVQLFFYETTCSIQYDIIEFSHQPVNEFTEFGEFLLDINGAIATRGQGFIYYLW